MEDIVEKLLESHVSINAKDDEGATPLIIAAQEGDRNILKTLLEKNTQIDEQDLSRSMALMVGVKWYLFEDESEETRE